MSEGAETPESAFWGDADDREALGRFRALVNTIDDGIYQLDTEGRFVAVNDVIVETTGYSREELLGEHVSFLIDSEDVSTLEREIERRLADREQRNDTFELEVETTDGDWVLCELRLNLLIEDGTFRGTVGVVRDITEQRRTERALSAHREREQELRRYETLFTESRDVNAVLDPDGTFQFLPPSTKNVLGYEPEELLGENAFQYVHPDDREQAWQAFANLVENPEAEPTLELRYEHADGSWIVLETHARNLLDDPDIGGIVAYTRDVTERTEREQELQQYKTIVEAVNDGVYVVDSDGRFRMVNEAYAELTGYSREELVGEHTSLVVGEDVRKQAAQTEATLRDGEADRPVIEAELETASGDRVPAEATFAMLPGPEGEHRVGVVRDISERREREQALEERERQLSTLMDNVPGMVYRCRNERGWPMEFVSDACRELTGHDPEVVERGEVGWGEDVMVEEEREEIWDEIQAVTQEQETFTVTYRIETAEGERRWVRDDGRGVFDDDGSMVAIEGIISDITERKRLEAEFDEMFGRVTDAFYALDDQWRITHANERAEELIDYRDEGLVGRDFWSVFEWATDSKLGEEYRTAMESQEPTSFEFYYPEPLEAWYEVHAYPSETGLSVYFRDITERKEHERELEESERRYRTLVENFPNGAVALVDEDLHYRTVGGSPLDIADVTSEELEGHSVGDALPPKLADELVPRYESALDGESSAFEAEYEGGVYQFRTVPVRDEDGNVFAALGMSQDITEPKEYQRRLAESERRYRTLAENFPNGAVGLFDEDLRYTVAGGQILDDIDVESEEIVGQTIRERYPEEIAAQLEPNFRAALDGETNSFEYDFLGRHWLAHTLPVTDDEGDIFAGMMMVQDITERKEYERKLAESERRYRTLAEYFPNGIVTLFDHDLRYTLAAGQGFDDISVEPEDLEGNSFREVWDDDIADALEPAFEAALDGEERSVEVEYRGREWVLHVVPITDERGDVFAGMTMAQDITEQKERERYLRDAKSQLEAATEAGAIGTWEWYVPEDEMVAGASFARTFGVDPEAAREGVSLDEFMRAVHEGDRDRIKSEIEAAMESCGEYEAEYRVWNDDDELRWVVARGHVECDDNGDPVRFPGALADITERKRAEQAVQERERQLRTLLQLLPVGVIVAEAGGRLVEANDAAEEIWGGLAEAETIADYEQYRGWWPDTGEPVRPEEWPLTRALAGEEITDSEVIEIEGFDGEHRTVLFHSMPIRDEKGEVTRAVVTMTDITEREQRQQQLQEQNERLESFASMLAHELRNPVTIGQIYSQQLPAESAPNAVEYVTEAFDRIEDMIDVMLVLTRGREAVGERTPISIADVAHDAWDGLDTPTATLEVEIEDVMQADETYIRHLFRNLFENAVQHGGKDVTVQVGRLPDGFYVSDDGTGISVEDRDAVFEAGFTTAGDQGGTGLGLAFVEKLADVYEWSYDVTESAAGGARFEFQHVDVDETE